MERKKNILNIYITIIINFFHIFFIYIDEDYFGLKKNLSAGKENENS